ncbi:hypothetical protein F4802DRAFT_591594 [Xylaria palmicola]|nr:hypothetical protein F4802DRAFT_591594 [Xylaria palmicola]
MAGSRGFTVPALISLVRLQQAPTLAGRSVSTAVNTHALILLHSRFLQLLSSTIWKRRRGRLVGVYIQVTLPEHRETPPQTIHYTRVYIDVALGIRGRNGMG